MGDNVDSKHLLRSKTFWLGVAVALLPLLQTLTDLPLPTWLLSVIGGVIIVLRFATSTGVRLGKAIETKGPGVISLLVILTFGVVGCGVATCDKITMIRKPHPKLPAPAATLIHKCGDKTTEMRIKQLPPCLEACFDESE